MTPAIYDDFCLTVATFASGHSPALPVSYPAVPFTPPDEGIWLEVVAIWNGNTNYGVAQSGPSVEVGMFRVLVMSRGVGLVAPQEMAELVSDAFPKGSVFGTAMTDTAPEITGPIQHDDKLMIPVTVRWRATR